MLEAKIVGPCGLAISIASLQQLTPHNCLRRDHDPEGLKIFCTLLQIAHMIMQLLIKGSMLKNLARLYAKANAVALFGSLKNIPRRLLECLRNHRIPDAAFDPDAARRFQLRLDTS